MTTRNRILAGIFMVFAAGIAYLLHVIITDLEPRYREAAEEPLVDISRVLAAMLMTDIREGRIDPQRLRAAFAHVYRQRFAARVYALEKRNVDLRVYVTDHSGRVVFDSQGRDEGKDYSRWRDVLLTLKGECGARTTREVAGDPDSSVMFVAAPIVWNGELTGVLSVGKPTVNLNAFARLTQRKIIVTGVTAVATLMGLALLAAIWLTRPFGLVRDYLRLVRDARRVPFPAATSWPTRFIDWPSGPRTRLVHSSPQPVKRRLKRVYKPPLPHEQAIAIIAAERGKQFDPDIVDTLVDIAGTVEAVARRYGQSPT